jgi:hypothetical protein
MCLETGGQILRVGSSTQEAALDLGTPVCGVP